MRARYYSPDMHRFINADIVAGGISNAVTLNRFAYANVDPFGLGAERSGISQADYEKFIKILNEIFVLSKKFEFEEIEVDTGVLIYYLNHEITVGNGPVDFDKLVEAQVELSESFDFSKGTFKQMTGSEVFWGIEYSVDIDDYNSVSASMTIDHDFITSANFSTPIHQWKLNQIVAEESETNNFQGPYLF